MIIIVGSVFQHGSEASIIFQHLTGHQLKQACDVAQQNGDHQLALLIGQASGMDDMRNFVQHQLIMWDQSKVSYINNTNHVTNGFPLQPVYVVK